jgi:hypothetical protein
MYLSSNKSFVDLGGGERGIVGYTNISYILLDLNIK